MNSDSGITITIVYDNNAYDPRLTAAWGFSCVIETEAGTVLFDTGGDGTILLHNMEKLGFDPKAIDIVFLSHIHSDHIGGLMDFLKRNPNVAVYYPHSFPKGFGDQIRSAGAKAVGIDKPQQIAPGMYSTGEMGGLIREQSLVIQTGAGLLIITGCSHPGIVEITRRAKEILDDPVYMILGGFHLLRMREVEVGRVIAALRDLGVSKVGPSHCTGDEAIDAFRDAWKGDFVESGCGAEIVLPLPSEKK